MKKSNLNKKTLSVANLALSRSLQFSLNSSDSNEAVLIIQIKSLMKSTFLVNKILKILSRLNSSNISNSSRLGAPASRKSLKCNTYVNLYHKINFFFSVQSGCLQIFTGWPKSRNISTNQSENISKLSTQWQVIQITRADSASVVGGYLHTKLTKIFPIEE